MTAEAPLKIAILGSGAMGSLVGGLLAHGGSDVTFIDVSSEVVDTIRSRGIELTVAGTAISVAASALLPQEVSTPFDCVIILTKTHQTRGALASIGKAIGTETILFTLQNGLGNLEILEEVVDASRILVGVTTYPAVLLGPAKVMSAGEGHIDFSALVEGNRSFSTRMLAALSNGNMSAAIDEAVMLKVWRKVAFNAALNTVCAVTRRPVGAIGKFEDSRKLAHEIAREVLAVGKVTQNALQVTDAAEQIDFALDHHLAHKPSMLQDLENGKQTEVESICGAVLVKSKEFGVSTPTLQTMATLVRLAQSPA